MSAQALPDARMDPALCLDHVTLAVADLEASVDFYQSVLGLRVVERHGPYAAMGVRGRPLVALNEVPGATRSSPRHTGLYHFALRVPTRADLGRFVRRATRAGHAPQGAADHRVSEAFYLEDPDGHGIEVYRDRPREGWRWKDGHVEMTTEAVDFAGVLAAALEGGRRAAGLPDATELGHVHLRVADLAEAERFYVDALRFDVVSVRTGAVFVSAGGYHHHFGLNTWGTAAAEPPPEQEARLLAVHLALPGSESIDQVAERLAAAGWPYEREEGSLSVVDPIGIRLEFR